MTTTSTKRVVTVALPTTNAALARAGERVSVQLPSGDTVHGRIASVGTVATSSSQSDSGGGGGNSTGPATITVTVRLFRRGAALDQAPVTVRFERSRAKNALAIPVTALIATAGGGFAVEVVDGAVHRTVQVTTGLYTSGFVQISGPGLRPGMRVTNAAL
jgi:multidrug efflux pump subunit AcrA (membrane-fusion protein)